MNPEEQVGIIEIGDIYIKCLIFSILNNDVKILSTSITPSEGFHNDILINLYKATNSIRLGISSAEKKANVSLKKINVVIEQPDFLCTKFSKKKKKIDGSKIYKEDIEFLLKEAKKQFTHNDKNQSIIHIFNHNYIVDNKKFIEEPIGVYADTLTHEMTFISIPNNNLKNINQAFADCDIEVERLISRTFSLGSKLLNEKELNNGSIFLDIGLEKTSLGIFKRLALIHSITFPFGINNIKKDISKVCSLTIDESENIINNFDFSFYDNSQIFDDNYLKEIYFISSNFRKISKELILNVIRARVDEIINNLKKQLDISDFSLTQGQTCLLNGEVNSLINIDKYLMSSFNPNIKKIKENKKDLENNFMSCLGALSIIKDGWETEAIPKTRDINIKKNGFFTKIFGMN